MSTFLLYLILQLDTFLVFSGILLFVSCVTLVIAFCILIDCAEEDRKIFKRMCKISLSAAIFCLLTVVFLPSTKTALTLYATDYVTHSSRVKRLTNDSLDLIENWVEKQKEKTK